MGRREAYGKHPGAVASCPMALPVHRVKLPVSPHWRPSRGRRRRLPPFELGSGWGHHMNEAVNLLPRKQAAARRIAMGAYPFRCCVVCGLQIQTCLMVAHLDQNAGNNDPDNLAFMCQTHHWMFDAGLIQSKQSNCSGLIGNRPAASPRTKRG